MKTTITQQAQLFKFLVLLILIPCVLQAQPNPGIERKIKSEDWQDFYSQNDKYKIQYRYNICDQKESGIVKEEVYLQVSNFSADTIRVSWDLELLYGERCYNCQGENDELKVSFVLYPYETISGSCGDENKYHLRLFSKFVHGEADSKLSDFNLRNLKINTLSAR